MGSDSSGSDVVRCPFWRGAGNFTVEFCDNFVNGVPACIVADFYPDIDPWELGEEERLDYVLGEGKFAVEVCRHFIRSESAKAERFFKG
ncbi:MAG: hypothetical protein ABR962_10625 [Candidatus Bathyarchaeia archaeon]